MESKLRRTSAKLTAAALIVLVCLPAYAADDVQAQFDDAMQAVDANQLRTAREKLLALLGANPSLHRARLELARVHYLRGDYAEARAQAQRVIDDPNTPGPVRARVLAFLAQIDSDEQRFADRHQWSPSIYAGLMYDSNVNFGPTRDVIDIGGVPFSVLPGSRETSDVALVVNPGIAHTYNPGRRFESGENAGFFVWQSAADAYYRAYADEDDFNLGVLTLRTGPAWIVPGHWRAAVALQGDQIWLGSSRLALFSSVVPTFTMEVSPVTEVTLSGAITDRNYEDSGASGRDGVYSAASLSASRYFNNRAAALQAGAGLMNFDADADNFGYSGPDLWVGGVMEAWRNGSVFVRAGWRNFDFDGVEPGFGISRDDDEYRYTAGFQHDFREGTLQNWALAGDWTFTDNQSDVPIYDFDRHQVSLGLRRAF
jgi:hypothetical protein